MRYFGRKRWYWFIPLGLLAAVAFGFATMLLWNALLPVIFHFPVITFWQAVGLLILTRFLFGGMGGHHSRHAHHMHSNLREKWNQMTPEEREQFRNNCHSHSHRWFGKCSDEPQTAKSEL